MLKIIMENLALLVELLFKGWVTFHQIGFEMFFGCITNFKVWGLFYGFTGLLMLLVSLFMDFVIIISIGFAYAKIIKLIWIAFRAKKIQRYNVVGTVTDKEYCLPYTTHSTIFDSINVNDNINLELVHMLDKNNKIIETILELPE